ncbi:unnamed protein product [Trifolium pratense]|uniref:Uncharacterized protein n=1 Tax=Trifolium pratense TaxID=57577 RepID=A0ACB0JW73_TRIPR|nr:unnamed protein product [Trifolium pratense]
MRQHNQLPVLQPQTPITMSTNNIIPPQNTTPSYFDDFTVIQENNSVFISPFRPTNFIDLEKFRFNFNSLQIATILNPNSTTITTLTTSIPTIIPTTTTFSPISDTIIPASSTTTLLTHIPTSHFDRAYNHTSVSQQPPRQHNQLPNLQPETSSRILPNIYPQQPKCKSRKRKNYKQVSLVCQVKKENLSLDQWVWRKYGQKPVKGSPHPRNYYKCSTSNDCLARKLVEKSKIIENTYVVTYIGVHNHEKPLVNDWNSRRLRYYRSLQSSQMGE